MGKEFRFLFLLLIFLMESSSFSAGTSTSTSTNTATALRSLSLKSSVRANIRSSFPSSKPTQSERINYPVPGKLTLDATQFCGDGDVANFAASHPNWDNQVGGDLNYVFGYWVTQADSTNLIPVSDNYFSLGTGRVTVGGAPKTTMTPATGGTDVEILATINTLMGLTAQLQGYRMTTAPSAKDGFKIFLAGMLCKNVVDSSTGIVNPIKVSLEMNGLRDRIVSKAHNTISTASAWSDVTGNLTVSVARDGDSVKGMVGSGYPVVLGSNGVAGWAKQVFELTKPTATDLSGYVSAIAGFSVLSEIKAFAQDLNNKATCAEVSKLDPTQKFPWEPYPLQLTCSAFNQNEPGKLLLKLDALMNPATVPTDEEFQAQKNTVAEYLAAGSLMQAAQLNLRDQGFAMPKQRCFSSSPYIEKVMASILLRASPGSAQSIMSHPEGAFAIGDYAKYYSSDQYTIFNMTSPPADASYGRNVVRGEPPSSNSIYVPDQVVMHFNVRGVGCSQNVYCWNDR